MSELATPPASKKLPARVLRDLARGIDVSDIAFDELFPEQIRSLSSVHWTPVRVARRAAQLLNNGHDCRVLDIGSGPGKFCLIGALTTPGAYVGIEQRPALVEVARQIAETHRIPRVDFLSATMEEMDWSVFTGLYLYNPFIEHLYAHDERIDATVDFGEVQYRAQVAYVQNKLETLAVDTRVVTYHGFGGEMPPSYTITAHEKWGDDFLVAWEKVY